MKEKSLDALYANLEREYAHWETLYAEGGSDSFWPDGTNLELTRNHIAYYKDQIDERFPNEKKREAYNRPSPPPVDRNYIAQPDRIRQEAKQTLATFERDPNYRYLKEHAPRMSPALKKKTCMSAVLGYVSGLQRAIEEDDLLTQRRFRDADRYQSAFASAMQKVQSYQPPENEQLSMFYDSEFDDNETETEDLSL